MGPRICMRGKLLATLILSGARMLQWGRAFACAERSAHLFPFGRTRCFNGAAHLHARKAEPPPPPLPPEIASMGPRICMRGKPAEAVKRFWAGFGFNGAAHLHARKDLTTGEEVPA